jgi:hypothetical protein
MTNLDRKLHVFASAGSKDKHGTYVSNAVNDNGLAHYTVHQVRPELKNEVHVHEVYQTPYSDVKKHSTTISGKTYKLTRSESNQQKDVHDAIARHFNEHGRIEGTVSVLPKLPKSNFAGNIKKNSATEKRLKAVLKR